MLPELAPLLESGVYVPLLAFAVLAAALGAFLRRERRLLAWLTVLLSFSLVLRAVGLLLPRFGLGEAVRSTLFVARTLQGIAFINIGAILLFGVVLRAVRLSPPRLLRDLLIAVAYVVMLLFLFSREHVDVSGIVATSAVLTAVVGFSLQETLANVMGGVAIQLDRSIRPGDWVRIGSDAGRVIDVGWRQTTLRARNGDGIIVPNSLIARATVVVEGRSGDDPPLQRRTLPFGLSYDIRPEEAVAVVEEALRADLPPGVAPMPAPEVLVFGLKDWCIEYQVRFWYYDPGANDPVESGVRVRVFDALLRHGMEIQFPYSTHLVEYADEAHETRVKAKAASERDAALAATAVFRALTPEERHHLASHLKTTPFGPGETIVRQGEAGRDLYVLRQGDVEVSVSVEGAKPRVLATLAAPNVFGEMGPLAGEPRRATVTAGRKGALCYSLGKEPLRELLDARPAAADDLSHVLAQRQVQLAAAREGLSEEAARLRLAQERTSISARIRSFFGVE